jgi:hypothetical protein
LCYDKIAVSLELTNGENMVLSLLYGGITHHYLASNLPYCNRINNNTFGTIHNEYVIGLIGDEDFKVGVLSGKDSACGNILGPITTTKITEDLDFVLGGYNTNFNKFNKLGIEPPSINGITPVIGVDYKIKLTDNVSIDNLISVGIITHSLRVDF